MKKAKYVTVRPVNNRPPKQEAKPFHPSGCITILLFFALLPVFGWGFAQFFTGFGEKHRPSTAQNKDEASILVVASGDFADGKISKIIKNKSAKKVDLRSEKGLTAKLLLKTTGFSKNDNQKRYNSIIIALHEESERDSLKKLYQILSQITKRLILISPACTLPNAKRLAETYQNLAQNNQRATLIDWYKITTKRQYHFSDNVRPDGSLSEKGQEELANCIIKLF